MYMIHDLRPLSNSHRLSGQPAHWQAKDNSHGMPIDYDLEFAVSFYGNRN